MLDAIVVLLVLAQLIELFLTRPAVADVATVVLIVLATGVLLLRRRVPLATVLLGLGGFAALIQLVPASLSTTFFSLLVAVGTVGALPRIPALTALVGSWGVALEGAWLDRYGGGFGDFAMSAAIMTGAWVCGALLARASRGEEVRRAAAAEAVREERARMTRELHDVVAHGLTVLVVQSVAAQEDLAHGEGAERVAQRLRVAEEVARESLHELRTLLGILGTAPTNSDTGLTGVQAVVDRLSATGFDVDLQVTGSARHLGPGLELVLYRVVQEGLTNACRHGDGSGARVGVHLGDDEVQIEVSNPVGAGLPGVPGAGRGLAGLRERVTMHGGAMDAHCDGAWFTLRCSLPMLQDAVTGAER